MATTIEQDLGLPNLETKRPQDIAQAYSRGLGTRSTKVADMLGKLETIPVAQRAENVTKLLVSSQAVQQAN